MALLSMLRLILAQLRYSLGAARRDEGAITVEMAILIGVLSGLALAVSALIVAKVLDKVRRLSLD